MEAAAAVRVCFIFRFTLHFLLFIIFTFLIIVVRRFAYEKDFIWRSCSFLVMQKLMLKLMRLLRKELKRRLAPQRKAQTLVFITQAIQALTEER